MGASDRPRGRPSPALDAERPARVIIADDDRVARESMAVCLRAAGHLVELVESGQEVIDRVNQGAADLVLLDIMMPRISGLDTCKLIKAMGPDVFVPVLFVTAKTDVASRVEGLKMGADDYLCKPVDDAELVARVASMLRIKRMYDDVVIQRTKLKKLSVYDELTGLYNQKFALTRLSEEFKRAERYHEPFSCMMIDIDPMRIYGSGGGRGLDEGLVRGVAERIQKAVREVDVTARYTPESFLLVLPCTHFAGSLALAERLWRDITEQTFDVDGAPRKVTVSIGIALYPSMDVRTKDMLLKACEDTLALAKRGGGNRICAFQQQGYIFTPPVGAGVGSASAGPPSSRRGAELAASANLSQSARERPTQPSMKRVDPNDPPPDSFRRKPVQ